MRPSPAELWGPGGESQKRTALHPGDGLARELEEINLSLWGRLLGGSCFGGPLSLWRPRSSLGQRHLCQPFLGSFLEKYPHFSEKQMLFSLLPLAPDCLESSQR